jgi:hypothetical protein
MVKAVPLHEAAVAGPHPEAPTGQSWSEFFQSLGQSGLDDMMTFGASPVGRFATSA